MLTGSPGPLQGAPTESPKVSAVTPKLLVPNALKGMARIRSSLLVTWASAIRSLVAVAPAASS
jgi:hypothetical protein